MIKGEITVIVFGVRETTGESQMRKYVIGIIIVLTLLWSYKYWRQHPLKEPEYPLKAETIEKALKEAELEWIIKDEVNWGEGRIFYELCNEEGKGIALISSVGEGEKRVLQINFFSDTAIDAALPKQEWEKAIKLAAILYGGFWDENQIYHSFQNAGKEDVVIDKVPNAPSKNEERIRWKKEISGVNCFIGLNRRDNGSDLDTLKLVSIVLNNNKIVSSE